MVTLVLLDMLGTYMLKREGTSLQEPEKKHKGSTLTLLPTRGGSDPGRNPCAVTKLSVVIAEAGLCPGHQARVGLWLTCHR